jgi:aryl carrier-like protein
LWRCFRRRGAYARFKELLAAEGCLEEWYEFEAESTDRALREWCNANAIHVAEGDGGPSA